MNDKPEHVAICVPTTGVIDMSAGLALANLVAHSPGIQISLMGIQHAACAEARNKLVREALEAGADWLFWLDSDIVTPPDALMRLLHGAHEHCLDIFGASYVQKTEPFYLHGAPVDPESAQKGIVEFHFLPGGCMLVSAAVYKKVPYPWYFESYGYEGDLATQVEGAILDAIHDLDVAKAVVRQITGTYLPHAESASVNRSEDANFCRKAKRHGYRIWGDLDLTEQIVHMGSRACSLKTMEEYRCAAQSGN